MWNLPYKVQDEADRNDEWKDPLILENAIIIDLKSLLKKVL